MINYLIHIDIDYTVTLNDSNAKILWEKTDADVLFRKRLDGTFGLNRSRNKSVFDRIMAMTYCEKGTLTVTDNSGEMVQGSFRKKDLTINSDKCYIKIKFDREDEYSCLDKIADKEVNILQYNMNYPIPIYTAKLMYGKTYQFYTCVGVRSYSGSFFDPLYGWIGINEEHNEYDTINCVGSGGNWSPYINTYVLTSAYTPHGTNTFSLSTTWVREIKRIERLGELQSDNIVGYDWDHLELVDDKGYDIFSKEASLSAMREPNIILPITSPYIIKAALIKSSTTVILDRCRKLNDVISLLISPCFSSWESSFFKSTTNPVSGVDLSNILITQKSDAIDPLTSDPATKGMMTFKSLMTYLKDMFQVYWAIDSQGKFRIEHKKYWDNNESYTVSNTVDIDLLSTYPQSLIGTNEYTFEASIPIRETFSFMEAWNIDHIGTDIDYSECVTIGDNMPHDVPVFTTDIDPVLLTAYASKEGFCVYHCESIANEDNQYEVIDSVGILSESLIANVHLSWANLHDAYWKYGRYLPSGMMNGVLTEFESRAIKYQIPVSFPYCFAEFNPYYLIRTSLGDGQIKKASFNFKTNWFTVDLQYIDI